MSKTPEELAEEYANTQNCLDDRTSRRYAFLAGYKAGCENTQTQLAVGETIVKELLGKTQWISVKDRLPDIYQRVLILIRGRIFISSIEEEYGDEYRDGAIRFWDGDWDWPEVTHWMPLPAPPKEEE